MRFKGEITVMVSLVFLLTLSLIAALLASATVQTRKSHTRAQMEIALESVFAEFDREMLERYDIFARSDCDEETIQNRLKYYGMTSTTHTLKQSELLTDQSGLPYYLAAVRYIKDYLGMDGTLGESGGTLETDNSMKQLDSKIENMLGNLLSQDENSLLEDGNPLTNIKLLKNSNLISIVISKEENISDKSIDTSELPSKRTLEEGVGTFNDQQGAGGVTEKAMFLAYLLEHFSHALESKGESVLTYELEYVLGGEDEDKANLEVVLQKILWIRMGINYVYLMTDEGKKAEAAAMAAGLCTLLTVPGATEAVKQALLLAWAYGESIVDLKVLMKNKKVPLIKTAETWQLRLSNLEKLGTGSEVTGEKASGSGLSYADYLKALLFIEKREVLTMRSLDLIEKNLGVQVDKCMTRANVETENQLKKGVVDTFQTEFYYK